MTQALAFLVLGLMALMVAAPGAAHDFWITPSDFAPRPATTTGLELEVGVDWQGDLVARDPGLIERFVVRGPISAASFGASEGIAERPVAGIAGQSPAGFLRLADDGLYVVALRTRRTPVTLDAATFARYLAEEGLEELAGSWRPTPAERPIRELFSRCAKSFLRVGEPDPKAAKSVDPKRLAKGATAASASDNATSFGLTLELHAAIDPTQLVVGDSLPLRLTFAAKPLAGTLVVALPRDAPQAKVSGRTNANGEISLRFDRPGAWLIKAVHLVALPADAGADWESFWASLTFAIADPATTRASSGRSGSTAVRQEVGR